MTSETEKQDLTPEEEPVTSRDEAGEPSGEEDPAAEEEHLRDKEAFEAANEEQALRDMEEASEAANEEQALRDMEEASDADDPLASAERQRDEYLELAQRTQADFENYRKRAAREAAAAGERAKSGLVRELLPIVDNLERALASAEEGEQHRSEERRVGKSVDLGCGRNDKKKIRIDSIYCERT